VEWFRYQCKLHLIATSSIAITSSITAAIQEELAATLRLISLKILHLKLAFQQCFTIKYLNN
jgi:hypothetical protein